eukprot:scaffold278336_cov24-Tisochrysis_lutea.AAC.1
MGMRQAGVESLRSMAFHRVFVFSLASLSRAPCLALWFVCSLMREGGQRGRRRGFGAAAKILTTSFLTHCQRTRALEGCSREREESSAKRGKTYALAL